MSGEPANDLDPQKLLAVLDDSIGHLTVDDIQNMEPQLTDRILNRWEINKLTCLPPPSPKSLVESESAEIIHPADDWIVKRPLLVQTVSHALREKSCVVIHGPHGSGRSHFWRQDIRRSEDFKSLADIAVVIDCFGLRTSSHRQLEQEALYAQFGNFEPGYHAFLERVGASSSPLKEYISEKFQDFRGIVVIDHIECLSDASEIEYWLKEFISFLRASSVQVLLIVSSDRLSFANRICARRATNVLCDSLDFSDVEKWWLRPRFAAYRLAGISVKNVFRITGGWPRLIRDLGRYLEQRGEIFHETISSRWLMDFARRASDEMAPEIERVLAVVSENPACIRDPRLLAGGFLESKLLNTGAFHSYNDALRFTSPVLGSRYAKLTQPCKLGNLFRSGPDDKILAYKELHELISGRLNSSLMLEQLPLRTFERVARILRRWGLRRINIYVRDVANAKLWSLIVPSGQKSGQAWPLYSDKYPDFALAVQSGRIVYGTDRKVYLPVAGEARRVEIVIEGVIANVGPENVYDLRIIHRAIWRVILAIRPAISLAMERLVMREAGRERRDALYRARAVSGGPGRKLTTFLSKVGCTAAVVLRRSPSGWFVLDSDEINTKRGGKISNTNWEELFSEGETRILDRIAHHPSRRGLVLYGSDLNDTFSRMKANLADTSVFVLPVWEEMRNEVQLVNFVFIGKEAKHVGGLRQSQLSTIAPFVVRAA